jgi:hypothetical protein
VKPSRAAELIEQLFDLSWAVFLWGPPGAGKSSIVRQIAQQRGIPLLDIRAALLDPTDIRGIPAVVDGRAIWCPPGFLPQAGDTPGVLFLDELSAAPPLVQASLYQLVLDRRVGEYVLPDGWRIIAAGNRAGDRSVSYRMPAALANRFIHVDFEIDVGDWRAWAIGAGVHPLVLGFIMTRPDKLFDFTNPERGFPTPRSWEIVSDALKVVGHPRQATDLITGIVGEGAAAEFLGYSNSALQEDEIQKVLADPQNAALPIALADQYALIAYIAYHAREPRVMGAAGQLLSRFAPELSVLLLRDVLRANPKFVADPGYTGFIAQHADLVV